MATKRQNNELVTIVVENKDSEWKEKFKGNHIIWDEKISENPEKYEEMEGFALPEPASYSGSTSTMVDAGTSVSGHLLGAVVRDNVAQISLSWNHLTAKQWSDINLQFEGNYINSIRFFNQTTGKWSMREMYISDRSAGMHRHDPNDKSKIYWSGCSLQLTEV